MMPQEFAFHRRRNRRHGLLAGIAVVLSAVVHVAVLYCFADWNISGARRLLSRGRDWFAGERVPPMRVETMHADPMRLAEKVAGERDLPSRGPIEVSEQVDALSQQASPALLAPPPIPREALVPGVPSLKESAVEHVDTTPWMPRQEISQIFDRAIQEEAATLPRREIPMIERVPQAPDIVPSIDLAGRRFGRDPEPPKASEAAEVFDTEVMKGTFQTRSPEAPVMPGQVSTGATEARFGLQPGEKTGLPVRSDGAAQTGVTQDKPPAEAPRLTPDQAPQADAPRMAEEERQAREAQTKIATLEDTVDYIPIDDLLAVVLETYRDPAEPGRVYFRIAIQPRADKQVPVLAKDIVWVQDVSASISEERLSYCRRALTAALDTMNPGDRFALVSFRDTFEALFPAWVPVTPENVAQAKSYVAAMRSFGQTDVFGSLQSLMRLPRDPERPLIAFVVTDGKPTFGMTESAKIIGAFSSLNNGLMSVYMYGTHSKANAYLLDMLSYCNRGGNTVLTGNRWDIPPTMASLYEGVRHPVMGDVAVVFDSGSQGEVYPTRTANLYKDCPLELFGACPDTTAELVFQVRGLAAGKGYDSIFRLSLSRHAKLGTPAVKARWSQQKMFHLVGAYSRRPSQGLMAEMLKVNGQYGVPIPYADEIR